MKQINMPVNEQVFQSLVFAHAKAAEYESADKVIEIMQSSGIDVNIASYTTKLEGMILAGEPAEVINNEILQLVDKGLFLGDSDYLQLIIGNVHLFSNSCSFCTIGCITKIPLKLILKNVNFE